MISSLRGRHYYTTEHHGYSGYLWNGHIALCHIRVVLALNVLGHESVLSFASQQGTKPDSIVLPE